MSDKCSCSKGSIIIAIIVSLIAGILIDAYLLTPKGITIASATTSVTKTELDGSTVSSPEEVAQATAAVTPPDAAGMTPSLDTQPVKPQVQVIMDNIYGGLNTGDHALYVKDFIEQIKPMHGAENLKMIREQSGVLFGKLGAPEYLGNYKRGDNLITLWKCKGEKADNEALLTLAVMKINDDWKVVNFFIQ